MTRLALLLVLGLSGCAGNYVSVAQGALARNSGFEGDDWPSRVAVGYRHHLSDTWRVSAEYAHTSHLLTGVPFNQRGEDWFEAVYLELEWEKK